ncbi:sodium:phosphate symporter [Haloarcula onubensis]|uniref:Sodium:phosphate symporter n=1 Tax=Haloarcula onubensis TaxID=2950539 RepID=A0ABU2FQ71_9EURY|nr:sodium:phosphate symporter [Halomicroarcula sp. S3CR25-11]MDS0282900.1 sodium:phosphate symporter [Halomicroarcula sp. S3CR25-11]
MRERLSGGTSLRPLLQVLLTVALFLFAIRLLGSATDALTPFLRRTLERVVVGDWSALGLSWLATYALANGSLVAALSLSLFSADLVAPSQLFLMVVGSRLGAAAVVVFIGAVDYVNAELDTLRESTRLGLLTFLLTHSVYVPALVVGYLALPIVRSVSGAETSVPDAAVGTPDLLSDLTDSVVELFGPGLAFLLAFGCILLSLKLFDRLLASVDQERLRRRYIRDLNDRWVSFGIGLLLTAATTSVAFSLGVVVPLYNRGHIKRAEIMPFVLGANVGTLVDTLVVAVALETPTGIAIVTTLLALGLVISVLLLLAYPTYSRVVGAVQNEILADRRYFVGFLLSLVLIPLGLVLL